MRRILILLGALLLLTLYAKSAYFSFLPHEITQPDGEIIECFVSGDEFYHWMHDKDGYTIIQASDGYYYYGISTGDSIVPTKNKVNTVDPNTLSINKWEKISADAYQESKSYFEKDLYNTPIVQAPHSGTLNNLVIYIRFSDDDEFTQTRQTFDDKFNLVPGTSVQSYYKEVSYNQLTINSTHYPSCEMTTNVSYQDSHPRAYFEPYNETTNPIGYTGGNNGTERRIREHTLLKDAIEWINTNSPVPAGLNIDGDNDGYVDNVCFNIVGGNGGWASLLWAHKWTLYSQQVYINGKRVYEYTFQPQTQIEVKTLCHEMFHALGAPDLYHYSYDGLNPAGPWDLMHSGFGHMGAYMKWKYTSQTWISEIPEITSSGTYTLNPLSSTTNNCYKIASPNSLSEYFVVEYRKKESGSFENNVPGSGLLIYRIDPSRSGNSNGPPDEVYIFRPNGTPSVNGDINSAHFSSNTGRTEINDYTNPYTFLQDGSQGGLEISNITSADGTISFDLEYNIVEPPVDFTATTVSSSQNNLNWTKNSNNDNILLAYNTSGTSSTPTDGTFYMPGDTLTGGNTVIYNGQLTALNHTNLAPNTNYNYEIWSYDSDTIYSFSLTQSAKTLCDPVASLPFYEDFSVGEMLPDCWSQQEVNDSRVNWYITADYGQDGTGTTEFDYYVYLNDYSTSDNISLLIPPSFNLENYNNATLVFWHKQQAFYGNQDELKVKYKTSPTGNWIELESYTTEFSSWTEETIQIPETSSELFICFEGNAKSGYGICIDDISITGDQIIPDTLEITDIPFNPDNDECFNALYDITVAGNSDVIVENGASVNFIAGQSIRFLPGFHAEAGSYVNAWITTTPDGFCNDLPAPIMAAEPLAQKSAEFEKPQTEEGMLKQPGLKVYPNPNNGRFTIQLENIDSETRVLMYSSVGQIVYDVTMTEKSHSVELPDLQRGIYLIKAINQQKQLEQKMVVW